MRPKIERVLGAGTAIALGIGIVFWILSRPESQTDSGLPPAVMDAIRAELQKPQTNQSYRPPSLAKRLSDMTEVEQAKLEKDFKERYKPTVEKWFKAYDERIPFSFDDLTLDKFHSCLGGYMYTFMVGDTTFTVQDSDKLGLKVSYLMVRQAAIDMNRLPKPGFIPNINVPITREEVIRMVKADCGIEYKPNEVRIRPTAAASALNGGAFVDIVPMGADPESTMAVPLSMVLDSDGKLVNYLRDPFF